MKNIFFILFFSLSAAASGLKEVPMLEAKTTVKKTKKAENKVTTEDNKELK